MVEILKNRTEILQNRTEHYCSRTCVLRSFIPDQGTQTDEVYEIDSMKREGLKFLVNRFYNYESKKFSYSYKMCSIADELVFSKSDVEVTESEDSDLYFLCNLALDHLRTIQRDITHFEQHDEQFHYYKLDSEECIFPSENSIRIDQMTQYGEDNSDEDFLEGMKFMAMKIVEHESARLSVQIDDEDQFFDWPSNFCGKCNAEGCERDRDDSEWSYEHRSDDSEEYEYETCPCLSLKCECNKCECAENKRKNGENYKKYHVWQAETPA